MDTVPIVCEDEPVGPTFHPRKQCSLPRIVEDVLEKGEPVPMAKVLPRRRNEKIEGRKPAIAEFMLQNGSWNDIGGEVRNAVHDIVFSNAMLLKDPARMEKRVARCLHHVQEVIMGRLRDGDELDVFLSNSTISLEGLGLKRYN